MLWDPKKDRSNACLAMLAAADYIEKHGWCRKVLRNRAGQVCIMGALHQNSNDFGFLCQLDLDSREFLGGLNMAIWNDAEGRTQEQVVNKLREIAQHL